MVSVKVQRISTYTPKAKALQKAIKAAVKAEAKAVRKDLLQPTTTWAHDVDVTIDETGENSYEVSTQDEIYGYVDKGTKPHKIRPKRAKALRFNSKFKAKTTPNSLKAGKGFSKPPTRFAQEVSHPGSKPRKFTAQAKKLSKARLNKRIIEAVQKTVGKK